jgi:cell wall-associated NlpC family hydrolase
VLLCGLAHTPPGFPAAGAHGGADTGSASTTRPAHRDARESPGPTREHTLSYPITRRAVAGVLALAVVVPAGDLPDQSPAGELLDVAGTRPAAAAPPAAATEALLAERAAAVRTPRASRSATRQTRAAAATQRARAIAQRRATVRARALAARGTPYRWGGASRAGYDCSGLLVAVWRGMGPRLPHNAARISALGYPVTPARVQIGDVAYWTRRGAAYHVGIVVQVRPIRVVDAAQPGTRVAMRRPFAGVRYLRLKRMT